ncbi:hypothetical protein E2562_000712 [Oryza meyeriana var. granulata]|uniref:Uncharacterized protein n=1 Tax=Oryza meyeriana var. granulata TaxID=110450 RepID=A0A6G1DWQ8_9ORYZ|nr:hypothetical protein E2562_000712 [Oryza meyeriana var. granulata]
MKSSDEGGHLQDLGGVSEKSGIQVHVEEELNSPAHILLQLRRRAERGTRSDSRGWNLRSRLASASGAEAGVWLGEEKKSGFSALLHPPRQSPSPAGELEQPICRRGGRRDLFA